MPSPEGLTGIWPLPTSPLHTSEPCGDGTRDEWAVVCGSSLPLYLHPEEASSWLLGTAASSPQKPSCLPGRASTGSTLFASSQQCRPHPGDRRDTRRVGSVLPVS